MGIQLTFNPNTPHTFAAPQTLAYQETIEVGAGTPTPITTGLGWNDAISVTPGPSNNITADFGSSSQLTVTAPLQVATITGTGTAHKFGISATVAGQYTKLVGLSAIADARNSASLEMDVTTMSAGLFGITANGNPAGGGILGLGEVSGVDIASPVLAGTVGLGSLVGLRIRDHGTNPAIKTGTGPIQFGDAVSCQSLNATNGIGAGAAGFFCGGPKVVGTRNTGWTAWTGASSKATFDTATATLVNVAQTVKALLDALTTHGLIGA